MKNKFGLTLLLIFMFTALVKADVAPDPGEMRVSADLTIETKEDLSDYRFFIDFAGALHEVEIKSNSTTVIPPLGGGVRYSSGNLRAIPKKNLKEYAEKISSPYSEEGKSFAQAIGQNKIQGVIELGTHQFSHTIKTSERQNWSYPTYRLERDGISLKLIKAKDLTPKISSEEESKIKTNDFSVYGISRSLTPLGFLLLLASPLVIIGLVIWLLRKRKLKE